MATEILELRDAHGTVYKARFTIEGDERIPHFMLHGANANINLDLADGPLPVTQSVGVLANFTDMVASLAALAGTIAGGNVKTALQAGANAIGKLAANAGIIIGAVEEALPTSGPLVIRATVGTSVGALTGSSIVPNGPVLLRMAPTAAGTVYIGPSGVALNTGFPVVGTDLIPIRVANLNQLYGIATIAAQDVMILYNT